MLRWVVGLLLVANVLYFAWGQGHLAALGLAPTEQSEPERLKAQIQPEALRLLNAPRPPEAAVPPASPVPVNPASAPQPDPVSEVAPEPDPEPVAPQIATACWQASGLSDAQAQTLKRELDQLGLPDNSWSFSEVRTGGRWVVYMGRYNDDQMQRKKEELRELKVEFRSLSAPPLGPGLALGTYSSEDAAEQGLKDVVRKGVRSARVAQERDPSTSHTLRLPAITADERAAVMSLGGALAGKPLKNCN